MTWFKVDGQLNLTASVFNQVGQSGRPVARPTAMQNLLFLPRSSCSYCRYSIHLPMEGLGHNLVPIHICLCTARPHPYLSPQRFFPLLLALVNVNPYFRNMIALIIPEYRNWWLIVMGMGNGIWKSCQQIFCHWMHSNVAKCVVTSTVLLHPTVSPATLSPSPWDSYNVCFHLCQIPKECTSHMLFFTPNWAQRVTIMPISMTIIN